MKNVTLNQNVTTLYNYKDFDVIPKESNIRITISNESKITFQVPAI